MKRREFILGAGGSAGILLLGGARAATPCSPILIGSGQGSCSAADAEADWQARIAGPGVVWYHDFRSDAEVDAFRWAGGTQNDPGDQGRPNTVRRISTDGITGACMEIFRPAGSSDGAVWWRPMAPFDTGSGKSVADPAANGTIDVRSWAPTQGGNETSQWNRGAYYGHESYHANDPGQFDGTEYYFQVRVKMDPRRTNQPDGGKLFYFTRTDKSLTSQEIVTKSGQDGNVSGHNFFHMYRSGNGGSMEADDPTSQNQVGNSVGLCDWPNEIAACWEWSGGWDTLHYHIVPGLDGNNDTIVQVDAITAGEEAGGYVRIWDQSNVDLPFQDGLPFGHNAVICSGYMNGLNFTTDFYHRYCQMIFSTQPIPAPMI